MINDIKRKRELYQELYADYARRGVVGTMFILNDYRRENLKEIAKIRGEYDKGR